MKDIQLEELKTIQVEILQAVHDYCTEKGLKYSLCGGALIGAIRHKGFIPWDDDIDILMPRKDYMELCNHFNENTGPYKLQSLYNNPNFDLPFAKVEDSRTVIEENTNRAHKIGVSIDVFPYDNLGNTETESYKKEQSVALWRTLYKGKMIKVTNRNSFVKKCSIYASKVVASFFTIRYLAERIDKKSGDIAFATEYVGDLVWGYGKREIVKRNVFENVVMVPFEDRQFFAFSEYDTYLRQVYGDYMQLPPEDKRHSPHVIKGAYWK